MATIRPIFEPWLGEPVHVPLSQMVIVGVLFFGTIIGVVLYSIARLRQQNGGQLSFLAAFVNSALIFFLLCGVGFGDP